MVSVRVVLGSLENMHELWGSSVTIVGDDARRLRTKLRQEIERKLSERGR